MPEYLAPGVYVEEVSSGIKPIEGVSTSTTGMVGQTERGPIAPRLCTSWPDYTRWFGSIVAPDVSYLPFAVKGFFDNGGQRVFIARAAREDAIEALLELDNLRITAIGPGSWGNRIYVRISDANQPGNIPRFRLTLLYFSQTPPDPLVDPFSTDPADIRSPNRRDPDAVEDYDNLGIDQLGANYVVSTINAASQLVEVEWIDPNAPARPTNVAEFTPLANGAEGAAPILDAYRGDPDEPTDQRKGLEGLAVIDEVNILCIPDDVNTLLFPNGPDRATLVGDLVIQCELLKDRFAVMQIEGQQGDPTTVKVPQDTKYGAVYYPWIRVYDPLTRDTRLVPPGGHMAGIIARTDIERGVHKAPANAVVRGIINRDLNGNKKPVEYQITKGQHDILNPKGINVIRDFRPDGRGIRLWGARTTSSDPEWKYVNVRRLFLFVEESIDEGTQWVVFEPNHEPTWAAVVRNISAFLRSVWRSGALQGVTEEEAFFVKCDRTTMTQDDIDNGRLICLIGIAPVKPAEFVIFRISQKTIDAT